MAYHSDLFYEQATRAYQRAAALDPRDWRWPYYRSLVHMERGEAPEAVAALKIVVKLQPDPLLAWWRLGEAAFKQTDYDEADAAYTHAETGPIGGDGRPTPGAYAAVGRARIALNRGDRARAITLLTTLVKEAPRFGPAHRVLAEAYRADGRTDEAERHGVLGAALRAYAAPLDPNVDRLADISRSSVFLLRQAAQLDLSRDGARREQLVRQALTADPRNPDVVYEMGATLQQLHRPADALPFFAQHLDLVSDDQQTLVQIGKCYTDLGRLKEAETTLRQALALGDDAVGAYNLGVVLETAGRIADAEASYRRAVELGPDLAGARNNLGGLLAASGRFSEAERHLLESIRLDPGSPDAYVNLSALRLQQNAFADAARQAQMAIDLDPRQADAFANLGFAFARLGQLDKARQALERSVRLNPRHESARQNLEALTRLGK
jgi:tetratricopeptide (TPR) repeat protein